jgi:hypothetical protein
MDLFDFDRCTGALSNYQTIFHANTTDTIMWWSSCFSPSGRFLYFNDRKKVFQMDLQASNLLNSVIEVGQNTINYRQFFKMELAPDNKIYISPYGSYEFMHVINKPDSFGLACNFVENAIQFGSHAAGPWADGGLPNVPNLNLGKLNCDVGIQATAVNKNELLIYPNPASQSIVISNKSLVNTIEITDLLGRVCIIPPLQRGLGGLEINIEALPNGIYFLKATDEFGNITNTKFVKQ